MTKSNRTSFIAFGLCVLCVAVGYFVFSPKSNTQAFEPPVEDVFTKDNWNIMQTDTFIHLIKKKYGESANIQKRATKIKVNITGANMKTQDFFNGNERLLTFKFADHGFEIEHAKNSNQINATFKRKAGGTVVPNDVLINLAN